MLLSHQDNAREGPRMLTGFEKAGCLHELMYGKTILIKSLGDTFQLASTSCQCAFAKAVSVQKMSKLCS